MGSGPPRCCAPRNAPAGIAWAVSGWIGVVPVEMSAERFDELVDEALDAIPDALAVLVHNVVVLVEDEAPADDPDLLGLYDGIALTERSVQDGFDLPDRILLFRANLLAMCDSAEE